MRLRTWPETEATCRVKLDIIKSYDKQGKGGLISKLLYSENRFHLVRKIQLKHVRVQRIGVLVVSLSFCKKDQPLKFPEWFDSESWFSRDPRIQRSDIQPQGHCGLPGI